MSKSFKEAWKHLKKDSKSSWSILCGIGTFAWLCYVTYQIKGAEEIAEVITSKIFVWLLPLLVGCVARYIYHYSRSDLYLEQSKPQIGKSLIPGRLLRMVEHWKAEPTVGMGNNNAAYNAYNALLQYRSSYEFDHIHSQIDEFIKVFKVGGNIFFPEIQTSFSSKEEAQRNFPRLKELAKEIGRELT